MASSTRMDREEHVDRWYRSKCGPGTTISVTGTAALGGPYEVGFYRVTGTQDMFLLQGESTVVVTSTTGMFLSVGQVEYFNVDTWLHSATVYSPYDGDDRYLSAIQSTANGTLYVTLINRITAASP